MGKYVFPCPSYTRVSSQFGNRINPLTNKQEFHIGIDYASAGGNDILAARPGKVIVSGYDNSFGNHIRIRHSDNFVTLYAHASKLLVKVGDTVSAGTVIAKVGSTGASTGCHLHFTIFNATFNSVDPARYVSSKDTLANYSGDANTNEGVTNGAGSSNKDTKKEPENVEISKVVVKSVTGAGGTYSLTQLQNQGKVLKNGCEILIQNDKIYMPIIQGDISLDLARKNTPGVLKFNIITDSILKIAYGNPVSFRYNGNNVFYGYIFSMSNKSSDIVEITAYDQLRYLKNEDTICYTNKKYSELVKMLAKDYGLKCGKIGDTGFVIKSRIEECSLFDMLGNASDETVLNTGKLFVLYDDFGKINLKNIQSMLVPILIDKDTAGEYNYTSTIDNNVYNSIKIATDNDKTGEREVHILNDKKSQSKWGKLQYYENLSSASAELIKEKAKVLMKYYNQIQRTLSINKCFGDIRVRGGSSVGVIMNVGDIKVQNIMIVEGVKHSFNNGEYFMDLKLSGGNRGGDFVG